MGGGITAGALSDDRSEDLSNSRPAEAGAKRAAISRLE
jgi:hypothetical protein